MGLYNTIGPRWQEIAEHLPSRTEGTIAVIVYHEREKLDGVRAPKSKYWKHCSESGYLMCSKRRIKWSGAVTITDEPGPGGADADAVEISDAPGVERLPACRRNQQAGVHTRKRKGIEIPMV